jgi:energy-coupling factor transporter transmembrane protein EcfT
MRFPPVFRLVALAALGVALFRYSLIGQLGVAALLLGLAAARGHGSIAQLWRAVRRIRWLLLSLVVVYIAFAPEPTPTGRLVPAWAETEQALRRAGVLVLLVMAVDLMRQTTPPPCIAAALAALLSPLSWFGVSTGRFSRRVALTLDAVPRTADAVSAAAGRAGIRGRDLRGWAVAAAELIREIERGDTHTSETAALPRNPRPTLADWAVLAAVLALILGLSGV